ncbi:lasso peptide biosynthesis B2 protein [Acidicapsa acidisoli]|uniref:lasso peptide biosynthesis B2 protein n=1 Tax=Acidicapsa acidisoli TaxID=1615681 RepID=UPI0021DF97D8|nr:lasso peptide biosynthesis B2 protein [Acidicapsa acidisoli]
MVLESWLMLFYFDCVMRFRDFKRLHTVVREQTVHAVARTEVTSEQLCHAVDLACVFYFKRVQCLQRSAAAAVVLRRRGWEAEMVIGAQLLPFLSHAWVEIDGRVVNDKPYVTEIFHVLERC